MRSGRDCCFDGRRWHKSAAHLGLHALPASGARAKCYMRDLGSCEGPISGEHLVTESILLLLMADGDFSVSGFPWIAKGEVKLLTPNSLTANCLCQRHNSVLSPLDDGALRFFKLIKSGLERDAQSNWLIISGHDLERWLLKTAKAMAASGNLSLEGKRLAGVFASDVQVLEMLDDPTAWPGNAGLYCDMPHGNMIENNLRFQLWPLVNSREELSGVGVNILGLRFVLALEGLDLSLNPGLRGARFRPSEITITHPSG